MQSGFDPGGLSNIFHNNKYQIMYNMQPKVISRSVKWINENMNHPDFEVDKLEHKCSITVNLSHAKDPLESLGMKNATQGIYKGLLPIIPGLMLLAVDPTEVQFLLTIIKMIPTEKLNHYQLPSTSEFKQDRISLSYFAANNKMWGKELLKALIEKKCDLSCGVNGLTASPTQVAFKNIDIELLKFLGEHKQIDLRFFTHKGLNVRDFVSELPQVVVHPKTYAEIIKYIEENHADLNKIPSGIQFLQSAYRGSLDEMKNIKSADPTFDINVCDPGSKETALEFVVTSGFKKIVQWLLEFKQLNLYSGNYSPIYSAIGSNNAEILTMLIESIKSKCPDRIMGLVNTRLDNGVTFLMEAVKEFKDAKIMEILRNEGMDICAEAQGFTVIHGAILTENSKAIEYLATLPEAKTLFFPALGRMAPPFLYALHNKKYDSFRAMLEHTIKNGVKSNDDLNDYIRDIALDYDFGLQHIIGIEWTLRLKKDLFNNLDFLNKIISFKNILIQKKELLIDNMELSDDDYWNAIFEGFHKDKDGSLVICILNKLKNIESAKFEIFCDQVIQHKQRVYFRFIAGKIQCLNNRSRRQVMKELFKLTIMNNLQELLTDLTKSHVSMLSDQTRTNLAELAEKKGVKKNICKGLRPLYTAASTVAHQSACPTPEVAISKSVSGKQYLLDNLRASGMDEKDSREKVRRLMSYEKVELQSSSLSMFNNDEKLMGTFFDGINLNNLPVKKIDNLSYGYALFPDTESLNQLQIDDELLKRFEKEDCRLVMATSEINKGLKYLQNISQGASTIEIDGREYKLPCDKIYEYVIQTRKNGLGDARLLFQKIEPDKGSGQGVLFVLSGYAREGFHTGGKTAKVVAGVKLKVTLKPSVGPVVMPATTQW